MLTGVNPVFPQLVVPDSLFLGLRLESLGLFLFDELVEGVISGRQPSAPDTREVKPIKVNDRGFALDGKGIFD